MRLFHLQVKVENRLVHKLQLAEDKAQAIERAKAEDPCWLRAEFISGPTHNRSTAAEERIHFYVAEDGTDGNFIWSEPCQR